MCEDWVSSTTLLWGDLDILVSHASVATLEQESDIEDPLRERQRKNLVHLMERESTIFDETGPSTSWCPKPSWCKHPSHSSDTSSNEYEWDSFSKPSTIDRDVDVVHNYSYQSKLANESCVGLEVLNPHVTLVDDSSLGRMNLDLGSLEGYLTDSDSSVTNNNIIHIYSLEPVIDLPLIHPNLIDWSQCYQRPKLLTFQNDYEIACYLNVIEPIVSSTSEPTTSMTEPDIK